MSSKLAGIAVLSALLWVAWSWTSETPIDELPELAHGARTAPAAIGAAEHAGVSLPVGVASAEAVEPLRTSLKVDDANAPAPPNTTPVHWTGMVTDADGAPLPGVDAWLLPSGPTLVALGYPREAIEPVFGLSRRSPDLIDDVRLAELPHARTDSEGRFALDAPHRDEVQAPGSAYLAPRTPMLLLAHEGLTTRLVDVGDPRDGAVELGRYMLEPEARLSGTLVDTDGRPLAGARVRIDSARMLPRHAANLRSFLMATHAELHATLTDDAGRFRLTGLWGGGVSLSVELPGFIVATPNFDLEPGASTEAGEVLLERGAVLGGIVTNTSGLPLAGAEVLISARPVEHSGLGCVVTSIPEDADRIPLERQIVARRPAGRAHTDAEGRFRVEGLDGVNFSVYVQAPGYEVARATGVAAGMTDLAIPLESESTLLVKLVDAETGAPISEAQGEAERLGGERLEPVPLLVEPLTEGLRVHAVGPLATRLTVWAPGYARQTAEGPGVAELGGHAEFVVELRAAGVLAGRVVSSSGEPLEGVTLELQHVHERYATTILTQRSGADGRFHFGSLAAASGLHLRARRSGFATTRLMALDVIEGEAVHDLELTLPRGASLSGTAFDAHGEELMYVQLSLRAEPFDERPPPWTSGDLDTSKMSEENGRYAFVDLPPGRYELRPKHFPRAVVELAEAQHERLDLHKRLQPVVTGRVFVGGRPFVGALVQAAPGKGLHQAPEEPVTTDELGEYRLEVPCAGHFTIQVVQELMWELEAMPGGVDVELAWGEQRTVDVQVPGGRVHGRTVEVTSGDARPGIELVLERQLVDSEEWEFLTGAISDGDGRFSFDGLEAGSYRVESSVYAHAWQHIQLREGPLEITDDEQHELTLQVDRGVEVSGEVRTPAGALVPSGYSVSVYGEDGTRGSAFGLVTDGRYAVAGLRPGSYRVLARREADRQARAPVTKPGVLIKVQAREQLALDLVVE